MNQVLLQCRDWFSGCEETGQTAPARNKPGYVCPSTRSAVAAIADVVREAGKGQAVWRCPFFMGPAQSAQVLGSEER